MTLKATTTTMMMRTRRKTRENDDDDDEEEEDYWYRALKNNNNNNSNMSNDDANTNIATGRLQLASLGLRKIPESLSSSFVLGVGKIQILDVSGNVFRDAVRFFSSPNDASKYPQSYSRRNHSLLSNVRCLNVSKNKHLTGILDLHLFKNLKYLDASETRIGKSVRRGETVLPKRLERVKLDACGWLGGGELEEKEVQEIERENLFAKRATGGEKAILLPNLTHVSLENNGLGPDVPDLTTTGLFANAQCLNLKNNAISSLSKAQERMRYMERLETIDLSSNDISVVAEFRFLGDECFFPRLEHVCVADNPLVLRSQHYEYDHVAAIAFAFGKNRRLQSVDGAPVSSESREIASTMLFRDDSGLAMNALYENLYLNASDENARFLGNYLRDVCARFYAERWRKKDRKGHAGGGRGNGDANGLFSVSTFVPSEKVDANGEAPSFPARERQTQILEDVSTMPSSSWRKNSDVPLEVAAETFSTPAANRTLKFNSPSPTHASSPTALRSSLKKQRAKSPASTGASPVSEAKTNSTQASSYKTARSEDLSSDDDDFSAYYHRSPLDEDKEEAHLGNVNDSRRKVHKNQRRAARKSVSFKVMLEDDDVLEDFYSPSAHFRSSYDPATDEYSNPQSSPYSSSVSESPVADELLEAKREMHRAVQRAMEDATPERLRFARIKVRKLVEMKQKAMRYFNANAAPSSPPHPREF